MSKSELSSEYITQEIANCLWLLRQVVIVALSLARLKAGNSMYAIDMLKVAGVDMTTPRPVEDAMSLFDQLLSELEKLL